MLRTTFANWPGHFQLFPAPFGQGSHPSRTGALESCSLGYSFFNVTQMDAVYHLTFTFAHNAATLQLVFSASGLQAIADEAWGLDNVKVTLRNTATQQSYYLPTVMR